MTTGQTIRASISVAAVLAISWCTLGPSTEMTADLVELFPRATIRPDAAVASVRTVQLGDRSLRSIVVNEARAGSRITWPRILIPDGAWLRVSVALEPRTTGQPVQPVHLMIGASDGRTFESLWTVTLDGTTGPETGGWVPVLIDLSHYGGEEIDIVFNTRGVDGQPQPVPQGGVVWGAPGIVAQ